MNLFVLDVDRTLVPFPGTTRLYKRLFLERFRIRYAALGIVMLILMHGFWFWERAVTLQRRLIMTLLNEADEARLRDECDRLLDEMVPAYREGLETKLSPLASRGDRMYLLSHCPRRIAATLVERLGFDGEFSLPIGNYFADGELTVFRKEDVLRDLKRQFPDATIRFFADDLVDLRPLKEADHGYLVNPSRFTRWYCARFHRELAIWD